ncbi:protein TPX2-like isoform X2 [Coffea arabica]|uniref:Protein TPX2-like isoform X2 n=1 Tax=Coffea arabica TaxID=13443 RepID=A0ABM4VKY8_COFAR
MDEEMEESEIYTFTAVEIDLDYEFDAVRYFDFSREESLAEAHEAELWFETATTYPPSPFVARLFNVNDGLLENVNTSPKPKHVEEANMLESDSDIEVDEETSAVDKDGGQKEFNSRGTSASLRNSNQQRFQNHQQLASGLTFYNHMKKDSLKAKTKSSTKPYLSRTSTLMKPTASQLAKQNEPRQMYSSRFQRQLVDKNEKSTNNSFGVEIQAAKRQKLEGGHLSKVIDTKHQVNFVHKEPKRDGIVVGNTMQTKLRITIPREPDLETTYRAHRTRPKTVEEPQSLTSTVHRFKALPLNRKILEAPSLLAPKRSTPRVPEFREFHLKTSERAMQHTAIASVSAASFSNSNKEVERRNSTSQQCRDESRRCNVVDTSKERSELSHNFKALPLNRKILSSKGDIGVFRNSKREITVPMEFNFHTEKRVQHNPPIELFNKLSLASEPKSKIKQPHPANLPAKGSKENRWDSFWEEQQVKHDMKEKLPLNGGKQYGNNLKKADDGLVSGINRSLGVR